MARRRAGDPGQGRHAENIALHGHNQDTATTAPHTRPPVDDALVLLEQGVAVGAVPFARHAEVRVLDFRQHVAGLVVDLPLERPAVTIVVRDTPRRDVRAAVRELLALGVSADELHVHRVEPSRSAGGAR